jgi:DNA-directed RNA polymerase specialized sigma24 family protein
MRRQRARRLTQDTRPEVASALHKGEVHVIPQTEKRKEAARQAAIDGMRQTVKVPAAFLNFLKRLLSHATPKQREALDLHVFKGLSLDATAKALRVSPRAIAYRLRTYFDSIGPQSARNARDAIRGAGSQGEGEVSAQGK